METPKNKILASIVVKKHHTVEKHHTYKKHHIKIYLNSLSCWLFNYFDLCWFFAKFLLLFAFFGFVCFLNFLVLLWFKKKLSFGLFDSFDFLDSCICWARARSRASVSVEVCVSALVGKQRVKVPLTLWF